MMATAEDSAVGRGRLLILAHETSSVAAAARAVGLGSDKPGRWLLLSPALHVRRRWEVGFRGRFEALALQGRLDQAADALRAPFVAMVDKFGEGLPAGSDWWLSRLAERNTLIDPTFLYACYARVARNFLADPHPPSLIVADSWALLEVVDRLARELGYETKVRRMAKPIRSLCLSAKRVASMGRFTAWSAVRYVAARRTRPRLEDGGHQNLVLVSTFFHEEDLADDGTFRDRYFPHLHEWLRGTGRSVRVLGIPARPPLSMSSIRKMRLSDVGFIVAEDWLRPADYLAALLTTRWKRQVPTGPIDLLGIDLRPVVEEVARLHGSSDAARGAVLLRRLPRRLAAAGVTPTSVVSWAENQLTDKAFFAGCRAAFPGSRLTAVQNTPLFPNLLNMFRTPAECVAGVVGDRVACSGPLPAEILRDASAGALATVVACGLRYDYLNEDLPASAPGFALGGTQVLFALPITMSEGAALLSIASEVLRRRPTFSVYIRAHPDHSLDELTRLNGSVLPPGLQPASGPLPAWLAKVDVLVTSGSGTALEAVAAGRDVVLVGGQTIFTLDPLAWFERLRQVPAYDAEEVLRRLDAVSTGAHVSAAVTDEVRRQWFSAVTDDKLRLLVE